MRAVNLLPADLRRAGASGGSGSGAGAYALIAGLLVAVAIAAFWALTVRDVKDSEAQVARLNAEAVAAEAQAGSLAGYEGVVQVANARRQSVVSLIEGRQDWSKALEEVSRTIPANVWITTMGASVSPSVSLEGAAGNPQRATHTGPAIELTGCTTSQAEVARLMARLRAMKDVSGVGLASSEKADGRDEGGSSDSASGSGSTDCSGHQRPKFSLVVLYGASKAAAGAGQTGNAAATASDATANGDSK